MSSIQITDQEALDYHKGLNPGKISVTPTKAMNSQRDLSLAYTPGVAIPCLEIEKNPELAYDYTSKGSIVAVISNGTAVLGLGDIGALASKPVMEGKGVLFKKFSALNCFDIEVDTKDVDTFCETVKNIAPTFGGINLEDIKAPECFEIEKRLVEELDIPVMHDDQHGTAVISSAGIINTCFLRDKEIKDLKIVVVGAGAAAISCAKLYKELGATNIYMIDSKGVVNNTREDLNEYKKEFACEEPLSKEDVFKDADVVVGLSRPGTFTTQHLKLMAPKPVIFTLANPTPEIFPDQSKAVRPDAIIATGRSDFQNQVNNVLGFPFIFRGAIDVRSKKITTKMKLAAANALAKLTREKTPAYLNELTGRDLVFGEDYIIPNPFDKRLIVEVSSAVAQAAVDEGVANIENFNLEDYKKSLKELII